MSILTTALELPEPTKPSAAAHTTSIEDPAKAPQSLQLLEQAQAQSKSTKPLETKLASTTNQKSSSMFTTNNPPKYNGPINGRDRRLKKPKDFVLPDDEEDAENYEAMLQYLSIYSLEDRQETLSMVYACPKCEVRIANEDDMVTRPFIWSNEELSLNAVFKKTSNLVACGEDVCCYRCRAKLFDYCPEDPFLLTVPMFKAENKQTLMKRAYRQIVLMHVPVTGIFGSVRSNELGSVPLEEQKRTLQRPDFLKHSYKPYLKQMMQEVHDVSNSICGGREVNTTRLIALNRKDTPFPRLKDAELEKQVLAELDIVHDDLEAEFVYWENLEKLPQFANGDVYDAAVLFRLGSWFREYGIVHTDRAEMFTEKMHLLLWLASGGNFLFADWLDFRRIYQDKVLRPEDTLDEAKEAKKWAVDKREINRQPAFAKLIADGHFLGRWSLGERVERKVQKILKPSAAMVEKMERALQGQLLYPNWLFLHDYPSSVFLQPEREVDSKPYSHRARDHVSPTAGSREGLFTGKRVVGRNNCNKLIETLTGFFS